MCAVLVFVIGAGAAYLLGAIPFGYLVARARGVDIRRVGSGNVGATNVFRTVGKGWGILTFACDFAKGLVPTLVFPALAARYAGCDRAEALRVACAGAAMAGHIWPVYLGFRGGKGVATGAGALLGISPPSVGVGILTWIAILLLTRYVSVASILAALSIPVVAWTLFARRPDAGLLVPIALTVLAALAVWRHKSNIGRLVRGTENRFTFRRKRRETP